LFSHISFDENSAASNFPNNPANFPEDEKIPAHRKKKI